MCTFVIGVFGLPSLVFVYTNYMYIFYSTKYDIGAYTMSIAFTFVNFICIYTTLYAGLKVESWSQADQLNKSKGIDRHRKGEGKYFSIFGRVFEEIGYIGVAIFVSITFMSIFTILYITPLQSYNISFQALQTWYIITQLFLYIGYFGWQLFPLAFIYRFTTEEKILATFFTMNNIISSAFNIFAFWEVA